MHHCRPLPRPPAPALPRPAPFLINKAVRFANAKPCPQNPTSSNTRQSAGTLAGQGSGPVRGFKGAAKRSAAGDGATVPQEASDSLQRPTGRLRSVIEARRGRDTARWLDAQHESAAPTGGTPKPASSRRHRLRYRSWPVTDSGN